MPNYKSDLSVSGLKKLLSEVRAYQAKVKDAPAKISRELAEYGRREIETGIGGITDKDGNVLAHSGSYSFGDSAFAFMKGEQSAYLEFGTGFQGKLSPHPEALETGWKYGIGPTIRETSSGKWMWRYRESGTGRWRFTEGIPAQMPVLNAARKVRKKIPAVAKEALK